MNLKLVSILKVFDFSDPPISSITHFGCILVQMSSSNCGNDNEHKGSMCAAERVGQPLINAEGYLMVPHGTSLILDHQNPGHKTG